MRMRVDIIGLTVSGPTRMRYTHAAAHILALNGTLQIGHLALGLVYDQVAVVIYKRHTCAVITAVFQARQPFKQYRARFTFTYVTYYSTHSYSY